MGMETFEYPQFPTFAVISGNDQVWQIANVEQYDRIWYDLRIEGTNRTITPYETYEAAEEALA